MGQEKALLPLGGQLLIERAMETLGQVCGGVFILSSRTDLATYGGLVADVHPGCGPLGGFEAALLHSRTAWSLLMAVDMPFVPADFLAQWAANVRSRSRARISLWTADGRQQPTLCLLHREVLPWIEGAVRRGEYKVLRVLEDAAHELAQQHNVPFAEVFLNGDGIDPAWFRNLNTPDEFAEAQRCWAELASGLDEGAS